MIAAMLAGCAAVVDADEARICRTALPALERDGGRIRITRVSAGAAPRSVRIEYSVEGAGGAAARFALCGFGPVRRAGQPDLERLSTNSGEVSGAALYLLKRYYIETPEGLAGAVDAGDRAAGLPEIAPRLAYAAQTALLAAPAMAFYALLAASYALIYGLLGRINLAFGAVTAIAAAALGLTVAALGAGLGMAPLLALPAGIAAAIGAGAIHALVAGHFTFVRVRSAGPQASLVATVGAALALTEYLRLAQGTRSNWLGPLTDEALPLARAGTFVVAAAPAGLAAAAAGLIAFLGLVFIMRRSPFGRAWRATAQDSFAAALFGIDGARLVHATLALAGAGAGLAAALLVVQFGAIGFADGFSLGLKALLAAILGGIGSVAAAGLGGLCIGLFESLWSAYWPIEARDGALYAALVIALVLRPDGLFTGAAPDRAIDGRAP